MLLKQDTLAGIADGSITLAFRRWRCPTVKTGGTLLTPVGLLSIEAVERIQPGDITEAEAVAAGLPDLTSLMELLERREEGDFYRIRLRFAGPDPRISLRDRIPDEVEFGELLKKVQGLDRRSPTGPWVRRVLELISIHPATLAAELANDLGLEKADFKVRVRKLKSLGLTESLKVGYRLSPRGAAFLELW
ncbi:MAG: hypothetical protein ACR2QM_16000 [Longimicrobiales bacterium]